ncbi:hypothetical protein NIES80_12420 [Dolichospermum planctonicum]|uniref:Uncharacterized protein n=1 Tax=Dolichospermum planctonicum TaxID=136072 RepID=A0A480A9A0_9CYAN|nr:hypothetical protein NIES80_12420 [Dolichospermum planctonicum]
MDALGQILVVVYTQYNNEIRLISTRLQPSFPLGVAAI